MPQPFFPNSVVLAWAFYLALVSVTLVATYTDLRFLQIPKWLTMPALALGVLLNVVLGAWTDEPRGRVSVFLVGSGAGGVVGALDGLLLALSGSLVGFGLFLIMFVLGTCRGGDVKLFAAVGAWVGPLLTVYLLAGTIVAVVLMALGRLAWNVVAHGFRSTYKDYTLRGAPNKRAGKKTGETKTTRRRLTAFSPAVAVSAALVLLWMFGPELNLRPRAGTTTQTAQR